MLKPKCGATTNAGTPCTKAAGWRTEHPGTGRCYLHGGNTPVKHGRYSPIQRPRLKELIESFEKDDDPLNLLPEISFLRALITDYAERYDENTEALIAWHASFGEGFADQFAQWQQNLDRWHKEWQAFGEAFAAYREAVEQAQRFYAQGWPDPPTLPVLESPPLPPQPEAFAPRPRQVVDILSVGKFIVAIGSLAERVEKMRAEGTITMATLNELQERFGVELVAAAQKVIADAELRETLLGEVEDRWNAIPITGTTNGTRRPVPSASE